ncbi:hypothetical protein BDV09DRAFT_198717 [Aspergillus tetrazonus]
MSAPEPLSNPQRVIIDTDLETGISHFNTTLDESLAVKQDLGGSLFRLGYITDKTPNTLDGTDLTNYIDYLKNASVIAGDIEVTLESGEKRFQKLSDMLIQRATTHIWRNPSKDKWARMVGVTYSSNPVVLKGGTELGPSGL